MPKSSISTQAVDAPQGQKNLLIERGLVGREIYPDFQYKSVNQESLAQFIIGGWETGSGNALMRIPFHQVDTNRSSISYEHIVETGDWTMNLGTSINTASRIGGMIDGGTVSAFDDLLIWAFMDARSSPKFQGIGMTRRPIIAYSSNDNGAKPSQTNFTVPAADTYRIPTGARVLVQRSSAIGGQWNHGTVAGASPGNITIDLDGSPNYGTAITIGTGGTIYQLNRFEPKMAAGADEWYPSGNGYTFAYMGHVKMTENPGAFGYFRKRGDYYYPQNELRVYNAAINITTDFPNINLGQWAPHHTREVELEVEGKNITGIGTDNWVSAWPNGHLSTRYPRIKTSPIQVLEAGATNTGRIPLRRLDGSVGMTIFTNTGDDIEANLFLIGWLEDRF